ncbi:MAG: hypothetical protein KDE68_01265 [Rhodocyclaceae bacterium]|nr:hypothetical protein [Rhodocyclaceae bacterium]
MDEKIVLHPAAVLSLWAGAAVFFQSLAAPALWWAGALVIAGAVWIKRPRFIALMRRIRVLLLASLALFALATPGTRVFPGVMALPLTYDGLLLGAAQALRLAMMVAFVTILLTLLSRERLILAIQSMCTPLRPIGVSPSRIAVRLSLVFDAIDTPASGWRAWMAQAESSPACATVAVAHADFSVRDYAVLVGVAGCLLLWSLG